ncbi:MAG TPA: hypothetical protein VF228_15375 [Iamia sp.]
MVAAQVVTGTGMALTGVVDGFVPLVVTQCLWGGGWALASGADVAWITDELDRSDEIDRVLVAQARHELVGTLLGLTAGGALAWATSREVAIVLAGIAMAFLAVSVARWPETPRPGPPVGARVGEAAAVVRRSIVLARGDRVILGVLVATALVNGGAEGFGRLRERTLLALGLPAVAPIVWFTTLAVASAAAGALALRVVQARIDGTDAARRSYVGAAGVGTVGLLVFALAPNGAGAAAGAILVTGLSQPLTRVAATVLVNRRTTSDVRATVHSMLSWSENAGELVFGLALAVVAARTTPTVALVISALLVGAAGLAVSRASRRSARRGAGRQRG